jgi:hypothetical protein
LAVQSSGLLDWAVFAFMDRQCSVDCATGKSTRTGTDVMYPFWIDFSTADLLQMTAVLVTVFTVFVSMVLGRHSGA